MRCIQKNLLAGASRRIVTALGPDRTSAQGATVQYIVGISHCRHSAHSRHHTKNALWFSKSQTSSGERVKAGAAVTATQFHEPSVSPTSLLASQSLPIVVPGVSDSTDISKAGFGTVVSTASSSLSDAYMAPPFASNRTFNYCVALRKQRLQWILSCESASFLLPFSKFIILTEQAHAVNYQLFLQQPARRSTPKSEKGSTPEVTSRSINIFLVILKLSIAKNCDDTLLFIYWSLWY